MKTKDASTLDGIYALSMEQTHTLLDKGVLTQPQVNNTKSHSANAEDYLGNLHGLAFAILYRRYRNLKEG